MSPFSKVLPALVALLSLASAGGVTDAAVAQQACSGTLCDVMHLQETKSGGQWAEEQRLKAAAEAPPPPASGCSGTICGVLNITSTTPSATQWVMEKAAKAPKEPEAGGCSGTICDLFFKPKGLAAAPAPPPDLVVDAVEHSAEPAAASKKSQRKKHVAKAASPVARPVAAAAQ